MKRSICLLLISALLLSGCGTSAPEETAAPTTEPAVTTEPTTVPTEPKTFFEEQGFEFWESFEVYDTQDGGIFAQAQIPASAECKVTITSGNREETTYRLADTKVEVVMNEYTLEEFDKACKNDKLLRTENIRNASDSLYKVFKEEDSSLTKEVWLEQYRDYRVIHGQIIKTIRSSNEVNKARLEMGINSQSQWYYKLAFLGECTVLMNCFDGSVFETENDDHPGVADIFEITTEAGLVAIATVADLSLELIDAGGTKDVYWLDNFFMMVPLDFDSFAFILPLNKTERTLADFEESFATSHEIPENPWEEKTFAEYTEGKDHLKYYFLSPNHY